MDTVTAAVARQYTEHTYPTPLADISVFAEHRPDDHGDPGVYFDWLWPEKPRADGLDILVAGCGTLQAAVMAFNNPGCRVLGIDLSLTSLRHEAYLREHHGLKNLELLHGDLREVAGLGRDFDLVVSSGVLHHLADPDEGLKALRSVMRPDAAFSGMVYGKTMRTGVYMLQDAFRRMKLSQTAADIALVRQILDDLPKHHFINAYRDITPELQTDAALVDTFLHPQDRAYSVPELLAWIERCGLEFQGWDANYRYFPDAISPAPALSRLVGLAEREQWAAVEQLMCLAGTHSFVCRLPGQARRPDFRGDGWSRYRPRLHPKAAVSGEGFNVDRILFSANPAELAVLDWSDGSRTLEAIGDHPGFAGFAQADRLAFVRAATERFWRIGAVLLVQPD